MSKFFLFSRSFKQFHKNHPSSNGSSLRSRKLDDEVDGRVTLTTLQQASISESPESDQDLVSAWTLLVEAQAVKISATVMKIVARHLALVSSSLY